MLKNGHETLSKNKRPESQIKKYSYYGLWKYVFAIVYLLTIPIIVLVFG